MKIGLKLKWLMNHYLDDPQGPCVLWPFSQTYDGYGERVVVDGKRILPHVYATQLREGSAPEGMRTLHGPCNNRLCIIHTTWGTAKQNGLDKIRDGTSCRGEKSGKAKLTSHDVLAIRKLYEEVKSYRLIANQFNVGKTTIESIINRRTWYWLD